MHGFWIAMAPALAATLLVAACGPGPQEPPTSQQLKERFLRNARTTNPDPQNLEIAECVYRQLLEREGRETVAAYVDAIDAHTDPNDRSPAVIEMRQKVVPSVQFCVALHRPPQPAQEAAPPTAPQEDEPPGS